MLKLLGRLLGALSGSAADGWSVARSQDPDNGRLLILRFRSSRPPELASCPNLVAIVWPYESADGMPTRAERTRMNELEDLLEAAIESSKRGILTAVVTGNGVREWQYYAQDADVFLKSVNQALAGRPVFPVQISAEDDPEATAFARFHAGGG